jgi:hypothetical protein
MLLLHSIQRSLYQKHQCVLRISRVVQRAKVVSSEELDQHNHPYAFMYTLHENCVRAAWRKAVCRDSIQAQPGLADPPRRDMTCVLFLQSIKLQCNKGFKIVKEQSCSTCSPAAWPSELGHGWLIRQLNTRIHTLFLVVNLEAKVKIQRYSRCDLRMLIVDC